MTKWDRVYSAEEILRVHMPHPRTKINSKIPRFSSIVKSDAPAIESPHAHENSPVKSLSAPENQPFNPRVAAYTLAFVAVLVGGLFLGATSKDIMANWKVTLTLF